MWKLNFGKQKFKSSPIVCLRPENKFGKVWVFLKFRSPNLSFHICAPVDCSKVPMQTSYPLELQFVIASQLGGEFSVAH